MFLSIMIHLGCLQGCVTTTIEQFLNSPSAPEAPVACAAVRLCFQALRAALPLGLLSVHISFKQKQEMFLRFVCVAGQFTPFLLNR